MLANKIRKIKGLSATAGLALLAASCVSETADIRSGPVAEAPHSRLKTIAPNYASLSNPTVMTERTAKNYYLDLERCRADVSDNMGGTTSDDVAALQRALHEQSSASHVVVHYQSTDRGVMRDKAVKACLAKRGYVVKL